MTSVPTHDGVVTNDSSEANFALARGAEKRLMHRIIIGVAIAVPVCIGLWVGLIALALRHSTHTAGSIAMAVAIGVVNGLFFGTWAAFVATTHTFEELDHMPDTTASELWTAVEGESAGRSETQEPDVVGGQR